MIKKVYRSVICKIFKFIPSTRLYVFKSLLLNLIGLDVSSTAKVVSSCKISGIENLIIGEHTFIGHNVLFIGSAKSSIEIGKNCDISSNVSFVTGSHLVSSSNRRAGKGIYDDIRIGDGVWIGFGSTILLGVEIGDGAIIAAGSVVTKNVDANTMVAGVPAIVKKDLFD